METQEHVEVLQRIAALFEYGRMSLDNQQQLAEIVSGIHERLEELSGDVYDAEERLQGVSDSEAEAYEERWQWVDGACVEAADVLDDICHSFAKDIDPASLLEGLKKHIKVLMSTSTSLPPLASLLEDSGPVTISPVTPSVRSPYQRGQLLLIEKRHKSPPLRSLGDILSSGKLSSDKRKKTWYWDAPCRATVQRVIRNDGQPDKLKLSITQVLGALSGTILMFDATAVYSLAEVASYYRPVDQQGFDDFIVLHEFRTAAAKSLKPRRLLGFIKRGAVSDEIKWQVAKTIGFLWKAAGFAVWIAVAIGLWNNNDGNVAAWLFALVIWSLGLALVWGIASWVLLAVVSAVIKLPR